MSRILIIGAGSTTAETARLISVLNLARDVIAGPAKRITLVAYEDCVQPRLLAVESEDPFKGGGRSKGEKKRAARERRMKGGY